MNGLTRLLAIATLASLPLTVAAQATDAAPAASITLEIETGSVLVSTGGEFGPAGTGQAMQPGHRVLVGDGASAILRYPDDCAVALRQPGVHQVASQCRPARAPMAASGSTIAMVGAGVLALGALAGGGGGSDSSPPPPISRCAPIRFPTCTSTSYVMCILLTVQMNQPVSGLPVPPPTR